MENLEVQKEIDQIYVALTEYYQCVPTPWVEDIIKQGIDSVFSAGVKQGLEMALECMPEDKRTGYGAAGSGREEIILKTRKEYRQQTLDAINKKKEGIK